MGSGMSAAAASSAVGGVNTAIAGAGTTRTDATLLPLTSVISVNTAANNSGVILPPGNGTGDGMAAGDYMVIYNGDSNTLLLYPPTGGSLNNGTVSTGTVSIPTHTSVTAYSVDGLKFIVSGPTT
jgi:hypothetical protein